MKDLKDLVKDHDLMNYYDELVKITKNMIRIKTKKSDNNHIKIGESKMGGDPDLPDDIEWPHWRGEPLSFLMQINLSEQNSFKASEFPTIEGTIYFFYIHDQSTFGFDIDEKGSWRVLYSRSNIQKLKRTPNPAKNREKEEIYTPNQIVFSEDISIPYFHSLIIEKLMGDDHNYSDLYTDFINERGMDWSMNRALGEKNSDHHLFGYDFPVQGEMQLQCQLSSNGLYHGELSDYEKNRRKELEKDTYRWRLLLQIDSDENPGWMWGDAGKLYFWINEDDLKKNNYDDVWMISQGG